MTLLDLTDSALYPTGRRIADFGRQASGRTQGVQASRSVSFREGLVSIKTVVHDATRKPAERTATIADIVDELGI